MFVFYFGIFANITPPVALAAFAGAGIAGGDPMKTGFQSLKLAIAGFIIPYLFVYNPNMLMIDVTGLPMNAKEYPLPDVLSIITVVLTSVIGVISLGAAVEGYFIKSFHLIQRFLLGIGALLLIVPETITDIVGIVIVIAIIGWQFFQSKSNKKVLSS